MTSHRIASGYAAGTLACVLAGVVHAGPRFDSAYTDLAHDCRPAFAESELEEGQDNALRCTGPAGDRLFVFHSAEDIWLSVENAAGDALLKAPLRIFDDAHGKIEWRMADGVPFAIIVRLRRDGARPETLEVRGLVADGGLSQSVQVTREGDANAAARRLADAHHGTR